MSVFELIIALLTAIAWTGTLVLLMLFKPDLLGFPLLHRYILWKFIGWSVLVVGHTLDYAMVKDIMPYQVFTSIQTILFRGCLAMGTWVLVHDILRPRRLAVKLLREAQVQLDAWGIVVGWNDAAQAMFGWSTTEIMGQEFAAYVIPDNMREAHRRGLEHYRQTGEAPLLDARYTQVALRKDGSTFLVDISLTAHLTPRGTVFLGTCAPSRVQ